MPRLLKQHEWLCDECGAAHVLAGHCRPLGQVWFCGPGRQIPFRFDQLCEQCGKIENLCPYPLGTIAKGVPHAVGA